MTLAAQENRFGGGLQRRRLRAASNALHPKVKYGSRSRLTVSRRLQPAAAIFLKERHMATKKAVKGSKKGAKLGKKDQPAVKNLRN